MSAILARELSEHGKLLLKCIVIAAEFYPEQFDEDELCATWPNRIPLIGHGASHAHVIMCAVAHDMTPSQISQAVGELLDGHLAGQVEDGDLNVYVPTASRMHPPALRKMAREYVLAAQENARWLDREQPMNG